VNLRQILTAPNQLTLLRMIFLPFIVINLVKHDFKWALALFVLAGISDGLDGLLARTLHQQTLLGQYLDPIADKLLLSSIYIGLTLGHALPVWVFIVVLARDLWILALSGVALKFTKFRELKPSVWGKASTFIQIMTAVGIMAARAYQNEVFGVIAGWLVWGVVILAVISAGDYTARGIRFWLQDRRACASDNGGVV